MDVNSDTNTRNYAHYLIENRNRFRTRFFQFPFQTHLRFLWPKKTLEIGCGAGRNLVSLSKSSVGIDHNPLLVQSCRELGLNSHTTEDWDKVGVSSRFSFDTLLISHVAEHLHYAGFVALLKKYYPYLKDRGRVFIFCPQEKGYASDSTHVRFMDFEQIECALIEAAQEGDGFLKIEKKYSFPFPRWMGKLFRFNEFIVIGRKLKF